MSKVLGEFLQEQQEPFTLELYLLERGQFRSKHLISDGDFRCCSINSSTKFLKRSASCGGEKRRKVILKCSKIIKSVFNKLVTISHNQKKNLASEQHNNATTKNTNITDDKFSSASSTTVFNSCSDISDAEEADNSSSPQAADGNCLHEKQVTEDRRKLRLDFLEESKQLSPVSVLEETESSDDDSPHVKSNSPHVKKQECHKAKKQEEFSTPSVSNSWEKIPESQYIKNKKAMQQSRQLLFDCVKEVVENQKRKEEFQRILGAEQLWGLLLQNIMLWSQDSINETSINRLMHFDLLNSFEESSGIEEKREIGKVVGDLIFVDISNEIALDMLNYSSSR